MADAQSQILNPHLGIAVIAVIVGFAAFWSNPRRTANVGFLALSLLIALWLVCLYSAVQASVHKLFWGRMTWLVGAVIVLPFWFIKESIVRVGNSATQILRRGGWWFLACLAICSVTFVDRVVQFGPIRVSLGFFGFVSGLALSYAWLCRQTLREMRAHSGVKRIELQIVLLGGSAAAFGVILLMVLKGLLDLPFLVRLQPLVAVAFYVGTVVAMTTSRVFNARQILIVGLQKIILVSVVAGVAYGLDFLLADVLPGPVSLLLTVSAALALASFLREWLDRRFEFYPQGKAARQAAFAAAQRERSVGNLETAFRSVLTGWGSSERALILSGSKQSLGSGDVQLDGDGPVVRTMRELKWATPERLARERSTPEREALQAFLVAQQLGVLVLEEGLALTVLVGVGQSASRRPYTYPQVTQLMELATIIEGALERAHFSAKVQHTEQLATVGVLGASLAHEIRNPLVSIKTFVQLLPNHYQDPAFRNKFFRLIGDEVSRIDQLTDQLLDLSAPRAFMGTMIDLHPFLLSSLDLVSAKASHKAVELKTDFKAAPDRAFTDASAVKQVMLNLCFNAIQAVESCEDGRRWVEIATRNVGDRIEMAVSDGGPGIAPEIRPKLFQPFQTTKSSGFGLGLAVCSDILANLHATISVDPHEPGRGATFRVSFPCQPLSS
jgi:signal transduction histidine kinase